MKKLLILATACFPFAITYAQEQPHAAAFSLRAARVAAEDIEKTAKFYESAFEMQEILRVDRPRLAIVMKFGATLQDAKADPGGRVIVEKAPPGKGAEQVSHMILNVPDVDRAIAGVVRAGGVSMGPPKTTVRPDATRTVAYVKDPGGNTIELLEERR